MGIGNGIGNRIGNGIGKWPLGSGFGRARGGLWWKNRGSGRLRDPGGESGAGLWPRMEKCGGLGIANSDLQRFRDRKCEFTAVWGSQL